MSGLKSLKEKIASEFRSFRFFSSVKWEAGKIRLQKRLDPYVTQESVSERIRPKEGSSSQASTWDENLPPFSFMETEEEEIFPNAKRKVRQVRRHRVSFWSLLLFLPWKKRIGNLDSKAFSPNGTDLENIPPSRKSRPPLLRNRPYFWEAWFPITSTLTLSPLLLWETEVPSSEFQDCLSENVLPVGSPGKWKVRIHSMRVLSHQVGSLYEDRFPKPNIVHRTEVWVYGHPSETEIDPENPLLFPLGVWIHPGFLREEDPRLRAGLTFRSGDTSWEFKGKDLRIRLRDLEWTWTISSETKAFPKEFESPHIALGKTFHILHSSEFNRTGEIAYLFKRAIVSDPSLLQRSKPERKRSGVSPKPTRI